MKAPPTIIFVSINLFFKELKEYYNPPISDLLRREGEREKEREGGRRRGERESKASIRVTLEVNENAHIKKN